MDSNLSHGFQSGTNQSLSLSMAEETFFSLFFFLSKSCSALVSAVLWQIFNCSTSSISFIYDTCAPMRMRREKLRAQGKQRKLRKRDREGVFAINARNRRGLLVMNVRTWDEDKRYTGGPVGLVGRSSCRRRYHRCDSRWYCACARRCRWHSYRIRFTIVREVRGILRGANRRVQPINFKCSTRGRTRVVVVRRRRWKTRRGIIVAPSTKASRGPLPML